MLLISWNSDEKLEFEFSRVGFKFVLKQQCYSVSAAVTLKTEMYILVHFKGVINVY